MDENRSRPQDRGGASTRREFIGATAALGLGASLLGGCGGTTGGVSYYENIVDDYETWDPDADFASVLCSYEVSKLIRGEYSVVREEKQYCAAKDCTTLKRAHEFRAELGSGPCDSTVSRDSLNGVMEGELVVGYAAGESTGRGSLTGRIKWDGSGSSLVGRMFAVENAGTHHDPLRDDENCDEAGHLEGWLRAATVDGQNRGCTIDAAIAYNLAPSGDGSEGGQFVGTLEGVLICGCVD